MSVDRDEAAVQEALRYGRPIGMGSNDDALAALARLAEQARAAEEYEQALRSILTANPGEGYGTVTAMWWGSIQKQAREALARQEARDE